MITVNREASSNIWRFFGHKIGIFQETEQKRVAALAEGENPRTNPDTAFPPALQSIGSRRGRSVGRSVGHPLFLGVHDDVTLLPRWTGHGPTFSEIQ